MPFSEFAILDPTIEIQGAPRPTEDNFISELDSIIRSRLNGRSLTFAELSKSCFGAWPGLIAERIDALRLGESIRPATTAATHDTSPKYVPELHLNSSEWYFSSQTADAVASEFLSRGLNVLFGTPTIAARAIAKRANFILIDKNPLLSTRFEEVRRHLVNCDMADLRSQPWDSACVILDPPWYPTTIKAWITKAVRLSRGETKIVMPLFHDLTRPSARSDRENLVAFAERFGRVSILENSVEYDSPLFEWEALAGSNVLPDPRWRRADLLTIDVKQRSFVPTIEPPNGSAEWQTYVVGTQVVQLRVHPRRRRSRYLLRPINADGSFLFDSVSARDPRRRDIDILTSRNRAARVGDISRLKYALTLLTNHSFPSGVHVPDTFLSFLDLEERAALSKLLDGEKPN